MINIHEIHGIYVPQKTNYTVHIHILCMYVHTLASSNKIVHLQMIYDKVHM